MALSARYGHTNIVARDWRALARFYEEVLGCLPVPPERDAHGPWVDDLTGVPGARVRGVHLRLPGWGVSGPTLEIFQYDKTSEGPSPSINRPGLTHLAFQVEDVGAAIEAVIRAGGREYGKRVETTVPGAGRIDVVYVTDPEDNIIELQRWSRPT